MRVLVGLGGNLGEVGETFDVARLWLARRHRLLAASRLYRTRPVGPPQPDFLNAVLLLEAAAGAASLLAECLVLEAEAGRDRAAELRWGPRLLDLDLLLAEDLVHRSPSLVLPHPRLHERAFALVPAAELAPEWVHPLLGRTIGDLAHEVQRRDPDAVSLSDRRW